MKLLHDEIEIYRNYVHRRVISYVNDGLCLKGTYETVSLVIMSVLCILLAMPITHVCEGILRTGHITWHVYR